MRCSIVSLLLRPGVVVLALGIGTAAHAAATLRGLVLANQLGGMPVVNVQIAAQGANPTQSKSLGEFLLEFPDRQPGDLVRLIVAHPGWVVVNDVQLQRALPRNPKEQPLEIIVCKEGEREQWAMQFYRLKGREAAEDTYRRKLAELESRHAASAKEREQLLRDRDQALAQADELARQLASIKGEQQSDTYQSALRLFLNGQHDQALALLNEAQLQKDVKQATQALDKAMRSYLLRGQLLALRFQFDQAAAAYEEAVKLAPDNFDASFAYGYFHQKQNRFASAEKGYRQALEVARKENDVRGVAIVFNNLGVLHRDQNHYDEARKAYEEAMAIYEQFVKVNPDRYEVDARRVRHLIDELPK